MPAFLEERDRNVIPRWRDFRSTVQLGELDENPREHIIKPSQDLVSVLRDWQLHRTVSFAGDLISAALVSGNGAAARDASEFVIALDDDISPALRTLALRVLHGEPVPTEVSPSPFNVGESKTPHPSPEISSTRKRLTEHPSDAILWVDLAYLYVVRGLSAKAERAIRIALNLAPANRFVLRSAARFFIHTDRVDMAHDLIRRSPGYRRDPWLVAAEIAIALSAKRTPWAIKEGFALLSGGNFPQHQLSELGSALGTLEFQSGSTGKARKFFRRSLKSPNDNSLAQAKWISRVMSGIFGDMSVETYQIARPFEASAYEAFIQADWKRSLASSIQWLGDQPFSSRPTSLAGYIAATLLEDFSTAENLANFGLVANPGESGCHINLAYCYASTGRLEQSLKELSKIRVADGEEWVEAAIDANHGLVAFRDGRTDVARKFYQEAVRKAGLILDKRTQTMALIHWASEEIGLKDSNSERLLTEAREAAKKAPGSDMPYLLDRLDDRIGRSRAQQKT